jgi:hypothetical protein
LPLPDKWTDQAVGVLAAIFKADARWPGASTVGKMMRRALISGMVILSSVSANAETIPPSNITCSQWQREPDGTWTEQQNGDPVSFGKVTNLHILGVPINQGAFKFDGIDLFDVLNARCGNSVKSKG